MQYNRKVIYTCITGEYDKLIQPTYYDSSFDYICFTDVKSLLKQKQVGVWKIERLRFFILDDTKNARWHKTHPHTLFKDYEESIWIDANADIKTSYLFDVIKSKNQDILIPIHFKRNCIYQECNACEKANKETKKNITKVRNFLHTQGMPENYGLNETNIVYRKHHDKDVIKLMEDWWNYIEKYSKRDQLSFSYVLWKNNINVEDISIPNARIDNINYQLVKHAIKEKSLTPIQQIFSVKNNQNTCHKVITILGIKIKIKKG